MRSILFLAITLIVVSSSGAQDFEPPVRLTAGNALIDTEIGHAAPFVGDWDGDGIADLLVGQFGDGLLTVYRNAGSAESPRFESGQVFKEGSDDGRVPTG